MIKERALKVSSKDNITPLAKLARGITLKRSWNYETGKSNFNCKSKRRGG